MTTAQKSTKPKKRKQPIQPGDPPIQPGDPICICTCPCCGAALDVFHGDDPGEIGVIGQAKDQ